MESPIENVQREIKKANAAVTVLYGEVSELKSKVAEAKKSIKEIKTKDSECKDIFDKFCGIKVSLKLNDIIYVTFTLLSACKDQNSTYFCAFRPHGSDWILESCSLPPSIINIKKQMADAKIDSMKKLSAFIRRLHFKVQAFGIRKKGFEEAAKILTFPIHNVITAYNTLNATLCLKMKVDEDQLASVDISLEYDEDSVCPSTVKVKFHGNSAVFQDDLKSKLENFQSMPLIAALKTIFDISEVSTETGEISNNSNKSSAQNVKDIVVVHSTPRQQTKLVSEECSLSTITDQTTQIKPTKQTTISEWMKPVKKGEQKENQKEINKNTAKKLKRK